jgi:hypothetical protein
MLNKTEPDVARRGQTYGLAKLGGNFASKLAYSSYDWFGTAMDSSRNWPNVTDFSSHGCQDTRVLKVMKASLARLGSECPLIGPESACGISARTAGRDWANRDRQQYWESFTGLKVIPTRTSLIRTKELLKLNRNQL